MEFMKKYGATRDPRPRYSDEQWAEGLRLEQERNELMSAEVTVETGLKLGDKVRRKDHPTVGVIAELSKDVKGRARATVRWPRRGVWVNYHHSTLLVSNLEKVED